MQHISSRKLLTMLAIALAILLTLAGCASTPAPTTRGPVNTPSRAPAPSPAPAARPEPPRPPITTQVFASPTKGQSADQTGRDRYECHLWAVKQTGVDPSQMSFAAPPRVEVPVPPRGGQTAAGAVTGAVVGAVIARDAAAGAVGGAILGGAAGAISESQQAQAARQIQSRYDQRDAARVAQLEGQANDYRRAIGACLEGRGYTVK